VTNTLNAINYAFVPNTIISHEVNNKYTSHTFSVFTLLFKHPTCNT